MYRCPPKSLFFDKTNRLTFDFNETVLSQLLPVATQKEYTKGHVICDLHLEVKTFRWLLEGSVDYFITLEDSENEILVCQISEKSSILGHSGLNTPGRHTYKAVVSSEMARFYELTIDALKTYIGEDKDNQLLRNITKTLYAQLRIALLKQTELLQPVRFAPLPKDREFFMQPHDDEATIIKVMRCSPFLDQFTETQLAKIAHVVERREYEPYEILYTQDEHTNGMYILIDGEVSIKRIEGHIEIKQRSITNAGFIFGWSCILGKNDICNAMTTQKTGLYFVSCKLLRGLFQEDKEFEHLFFKRLLWLVSNQMNAAFMRYAGLLGKHNLQAVFQLISNSKSRIPLTSRLHSIAHLLKDNNTKEMAYDCLKNVVSQGTALERHIASLSLELLKEDQEELRFIKGLQHIYETVAHHTSTDSAVIRKDCALATQELFKGLDHHIEGWENLPDTSGNIFIYNHLINHKHYTLNNKFQITLDSHFISGLILDKKYGEPGIRTVRIGRGQEYGHQNYYKKLGHINVYTPESDCTSREEQKHYRGIFYREAENYLKKGTNLLISPEGTSYKTENSPGPFKLGSFKLALKMNPEPYIIPLVLVNFDHRIKENHYYCKILPPFKLSEKVDRCNVDDLLNFVTHFQEDYTQYVNEARETAKTLQDKGNQSNDALTPPEIWSNEIVRLKRRVHQLTHTQNLVAFYGSSSIRLWVSMQKDLQPLNVVNLGFGGSSFAWCIHYFDEIFEGIQPKKVVLYAGENDLDNGKSPQEVLTDCKELVQRIQRKYPEIELALISLKPSVKREAMIPQIMETNLLLSKYIIGELNAQFINVFARMITSDNRPKPELYLSDGLHLNKAGYEIWSHVVKEALLPQEEIAKL